MENERNLFEKGLYVGLGLAHRTQDKIKEFAQKVSDEYEMNQEEGERFIDDLVKESGRSNDRLNELIKKRFESYLKNAGIPQKEDIDALSEKIDELEKKL